jgi:hypothetical protein
MQHYTIFFIIVNALHVSGGFNNYAHSVIELELNHASGGSKQAWPVPDAVCAVLELLMMGGETARNK